MKTGCVFCLALIITMMSLNHVETVPVDGYIAYLPHDNKALSCRPCYECDEANCPRQCCDKVEADVMMLVKPLSHSKSVILIGQNHIT